MCKNPLAYGITAVQHKSDIMLQQRSCKLVVKASKLLEERKMVWYNPDLGNLVVTNLGRFVSHFYIRNLSVVTFNKIIEKKWCC